MKTRLDFVTNSSSSSFIISKEKGYNSVEEVFLFLKSLCNEYLEKRKELIEYCKKDKQFTISEETDVVNIKLNVSDIDDRVKMMDFIEDKFGMTWYDISCDKIDWLKCETYAEFLEYTKDGYFYIHIVDLFNPQFHENSDIDSLDSLIDWYMPCYTTNNIADCKNCEYKKYCSIDDDNKDIVKNIKSTKSEESRKNLIYTVFGRFCICSECGYIPEYVVQKLGKASTFWCNHMG